MLRTVLTYTILASQLYMTLLVGAGRGPFSLYNSYWSCHCADQETAGELTLVDPYSPNLIGETGYSENGIDQDICRAPRIGDRDDLSSPDICPRKMPLRYLSLLLEGSVIIFSESIPVLPKTTYQCLYTVFQDDHTILSGHPELHLPPPRSV